MPASIAGICNRSILEPLINFQLTLFNTARDSYFDVTAGDAIEVVEKDAKKTIEARKEDVEFIRRLRRNEFVRFGARDWEQQGRFDRSAARQAGHDERVEKELKRKSVSI